MDADFDPAEKASWYFGSISRDVANEILNERVVNGTFMVRDSTTMPGDFVLCVREDQKVSHYIVNRVVQDGGMRYKIGEQDFPDIPSMLTFYKTHYLDTTSLIRPAEKIEFKVIANYDFSGRDPDDLPFDKGDILTVISKDEEQWWTARNSQGKEGAIPVPYIALYDESQASYTRAPEPEKPVKETMGQMVKKLPAKAEVITQRIPNAYDKTALRLEVGDTITVTACPVNGQWEGITSSGKKGNFPFNHVRIVDQ